MDYRGFRLVAMPLLPLQRLVYGSQDLGEKRAAFVRSLPIRLLCLGVAKCLC